jgi:hypothetical protein
MVWLHPTHRGETAMNGQPVLACWLRRSARYRVSPLRRAIKPHAFGQDDVLYFRFGRGEGALW